MALLSSFIMSSKVNICSSIFWARSASPSPNRVQNSGFVAGTQEIQYFRCGFGATQCRLFDAVPTGKHLGQHVIEFLECVGLYAIQLGDSKDHIVPQALIERAQHPRRLVAIQVNEYGGDDLGVLAANQFGDRGCIHPLEALDATDVASLEDAVNQQ